MEKARRQQLLNFMKELKNDFDEYRYPTKVNMCESIIKIIQNHDKVRKVK